MTNTEQGKQDIFLPVSYEGIEPDAVVERVSDLPLWPVISTQMLIFSNSNELEYEVLLHEDCILYSRKYGRGVKFSH